MPNTDMDSSFRQNTFDGFTEVFNKQPHTSTTSESTNTSSASNISSVKGNTPETTSVMSKEVTALLQAFSKGMTTPPLGNTQLPPGSSTATVSASEWLQLGIAGKLALIMSEIAKINIEQNPMMALLTTRIMEATRTMALAMKDLQEKMTDAQVDSLKADAAKAWAAMGTAIASAVTTIVVAAASYTMSSTAETEARGRGEALGYDKNTTERMGMEAASKTGRYAEMFGQVIEKGLNAFERGVSATQDTRKAEDAGMQGMAQAAKEYLEKVLSALQKTLQDVADAVKSDQEKLNSVLAFLKEIQQLESQITRQA